MKKCWTCVRLMLSYPKGEVTPLYVCEFNILGCFGLDDIKQMCCSNYMGRQP